MPFKPVRDPITGLVTMVNVPDATSFGGSDGSQWLDHLGIALPTAEEVGKEIDQEALGELCDIIALATLGGYDAGELVEEQVEMLVEFEGMTTTEAIAFIDRLTRIARDRHAEMAAAWEGPTDNDALAAAFTSLEANGIVARHDLGLSLSDGSEEIDAIVATANAHGDKIEGSVFYHRQDTDRAIQGRGLYLVYTGGTPGNEPARVVGQKIHDTLNDHGLRVVWDGRPSSRLLVEMTWRHRPTEQTDTMQTPQAA